MFSEKVTGSGELSLSFPVLSQLREALSILELNVLVPLHIPHFFFHFGSVLLCKSLTRLSFSTVLRGTAAT